ncbi:MAG: helix-turn-helix transcriptional regulator [Clostridia bacterium]
MNYEIADKLIELRKTAGFSQEELANKIGVSRQAVSKWERGEASPDTDNIIALANLYGVSVDELLCIASNGGSDGNAQNAKRGKKRIHVNIPGFVNINVDDREDESDSDEEWFSKNSNAFDYDVEDVHYHKKNKKSIWYSFPYPIFATIVFLALGFIWNLWHPGWIVFLTIPFYYTVVNAIVNRKLPTVSVSVVITMIYLVLGIGFGLWHPWWLMFLAIPIFDFIIKAFKK